MRERLDNRRDCLTIKRTVAGKTYHFTYGAYPNGTLAEIFVHGPKVGSEVMTQLQGASVLVSIALQHGAQPLELLAAQPRDANGQPEGPMAVALQTWIDDQWQLTNPTP